MITKVKKNSQHTQRKGFTKPSYIESAIQFRDISNCGFRNHSEEHDLYQKHRNMQLEFLEYTRYGGGVYNFRRVF